MTDEETLALADQMFRCIEEGDLDTLRGLYADDIVVWANFDGVEQSLESSMKILRWLTRTLGDRRYEVRRREIIPGGFLQEHVLRGTAPDGTSIAIRFTRVSSQVCKVEIRVGVFGDQTLSRLIMSNIDNQLVALGVDPNVIKGSEE